MNETEAAGYQMMDELMAWWRRCLQQDYDYAMGVGVSGGWRPHGWEELVADVWAKRDIMDEYDAAVAELTGYQADAEHLTHMPAAEFLDHLIHTATARIYQSARIIRLLADAYSGRVGYDAAWRVVKIEPKDDCDECDRQIELPS